MSSSSNLLSHSPDLPPGWSICYPPSSSSLKSPRDETAPPQLIPPPPTIGSDNSQITPLIQLAPRPPGYVSLPRTYAQQQKIYPYLRNPYIVNVTTKAAVTSHSSDQHNMSNYSTWRADAPPSFDLPYPPAPSPLPPAPYDAHTRRGSPFTVYHTCVRCKHPRSIRYHQEHPHSAQYGPSPSLCRRCRKIEEIFSDDEQQMQVVPINSIPTQPQTQLAQSVRDRRKGRSSEYSEDVDGGVRLRGRRRERKSGYV